MNKSNKTVLITGGGSGIGFALAKKFKENGNTVIITGRTMSKLKAAKEQLGGVYIYQSDVTIEDQVKKLAEDIQNTFNGIDILVNNAGIMNLVDVGYEGNEVQKLMQEIDINYSAPIKILHYFLPQLKRSKEATLINVSSGLAYMPFAQAPIYSGTKAALHAWTRAIRPQLKSHQIKVIELLPPVVDTPLAHGANLDEDQFLKPMSPNKMADIFWKGFKRGKKEILPGISRPLKTLSKVIPTILFNQFNKKPIPERK